MIGLRPILSDSAPNTMKNGVPRIERAGDHQVRGRRLDLERLREEEQRVELPVYQTTAWPAVRAEQREQHDLQVAPAAGRTR